MDIAVKGGNELKSIHVRNQRIIFGLFQSDSNNKNDNIMVPASTGGMTL